MARRLQIAFLFIAATSAVRTPPVTGQQCTDGEISFIFVNSHPVFDTGDLNDDRAFPWIYDVANGFHMETDEEFLKGELPIRGW